MNALWDNYEWNHFHIMYQTLRCFILLVFSGQTHLLSWSTFLIATISPESHSLAWYTTPKLPFPMTCTVGVVTMSGPRGSWWSLPWCRCRTPPWTCPAPGPDSLSRSSPCSRPCLRSSSRQNCSRYRLSVNLRRMWCEACWSSWKKKITE